MMTTKEKIRTGIYLFTEALKRTLSRTNLIRFVKMATLLLLVLCVPTLLGQAPPAEQWQPEVKATFLIASMALLNYLAMKN